MNNYSDPLEFKRGKPMPNRLMLAPLTNTQSNVDGTLGKSEFDWLMMRATGGFGSIMTCASHVQPQGQGFPGQLGCFDDIHIPGLTRIADGIMANGGVGLLQLHHAGARSPAHLIGQPPVGPSVDDKGTIALSTAQVSELRDSFIGAALRCERAGFDGVELHGAHGYILAQFLSAKTNQRDDQYGGDLANRARLINEILDGIRSACGANFIVGLRLSPERFGMQMAEMLTLAGGYLKDDRLDFLDMSLWEVFKEPVEPEFSGKSLLAWFTGLERSHVRLGVAGKMNQPGDVNMALEGGADFVLLGRSAILNPDFPAQMANPDFVAVEAPVEGDYLLAQGVSQVFVDYLRGFGNLVV